MNWSALGAVSELAAALAFLASFIFVRQQMSQNHEVTKASHQREILNASRDFLLRQEVIKRYLKQSPRVLGISNPRMLLAGMYSLRG